MKTAAIGELLFDRFPDRDRLGGAPCNVAAMLSQFGLDSHLISAVGRDRLAGRALAELAALGVDTSAVQENELPTGEVRVTLDSHGKPTYTFAEKSAWDQIRWTPASFAAADRLLPPSISFPASSAAFSNEQTSSSSCFPSIIRTNSPLGGFCS